MIVVDNTKNDVKCMNVISSYLILKRQGRIHDDVPHEAHHIVPAFDTAGLLWCA